MAGIKHGAGRKKLTCVQSSFAEDAVKTVQMVHIVIGTSDDGLWCDPCHQLCIRYCSTDDRKMLTLLAICTFGFGEALVKVLFTVRLLGRERLKLHDAVLIGRREHTYLSVPEVTLDRERRVAVTAHEAVCNDTGQVERRDRHEDDILACQHV